MRMFMSGIARKERSKIKFLLVHWASVTKYLPLDGLHPTEICFSSSVYWEAQWKVMTDLGSGEGLLPVCWRLWLIHKTASPFCPHLRSLISHLKQKSHDLSTSWKTLLFNSNAPATEFQYEFYKRPSIPI